MTRRLFNSLLRLRVRASAAVALLDKPVNAMILKRELENIRV